MDDNKDKSPQVMYSPEQTKPKPLDIPEQKKTTYVGGAIPQTQYKEQGANLTRRRFIGAGVFTALAGLVGFKIGAENAQTIKSGADKVVETAGEVSEGVKLGVDRLKKDIEPIDKLSKEAREDYQRSRGIKPTPPAEAEPK